MDGIVITILLSAYLLVIRKQLKQNQSSLDEDVKPAVVEK